MGHGPAAQRPVHMMKTLSHYRKGAEVAMVDVTAKTVTSRTAIAHGFVRIGGPALAQIRRRNTPKGNPLEIARIAGIAAAKRTSEWIPLCHPLPLTFIDVTTRLCKNGIELTSRVTATAQTGVEMEALVAVSAAALTIYDMCKALDKAMEITDIYLVEKIGGKSGHFLRESPANKTRASKKNLGKRKQQRKP
jgi:cyclic pyranopterin phosphate synthase